MDRIVAVGIGSNLGDRHAHIDYARDRLTTCLTDLRVSTIRETDPVGVPDAQSRYLNAVAMGRSSEPPRALLEALLAIERERGRERPYLNAPRTLDLDLLLVGELTVDEPGLTLPHPRMRDRLFVIEPLFELEATTPAPQRWRHPVSGETVEEMLLALRRFRPAPSTTRR